MPFLVSLCVCLFPFAVFAVEESVHFLALNLSQLFFRAVHNVWDQDLIFIIRTLQFCIIVSVQFSRSVVSNSLRPHGLQHASPPCHHQLPKFTKTHLHWVGDAIQQSHPLSSPSPTFKLSQHQGLFKWVSCGHQVAKLLEFQLQQKSFQWIFRDDFL